MPDQRDPGEEPNKKARSHWMVRVLRWGILVPVLLGILSLATGPPKTPEILLEVGGAVAISVGILLGFSFFVSFLTRHRAPGPSEDDETPGLMSVIASLFRALRSATPSASSTSMERVGPRLPDRAEDYVVGAGGGCFLYSIALVGWLILSLTIVLLFQPGIFEWRDAGGEGRLGQVVLVIFTAWILYIVTYHRRTVISNRNRTVASRTRLFFFSWGTSKPYNRFERLSLKRQVATRRVKRGDRYQDVRDTSYVVTLVGEEEFLVKGFATRAEAEEEMIAVSGYMGLPASIDYDQDAEDPPEESESS